MTEQQTKLPPAVAQVLYDYALYIGEVGETLRLSLFGIQLIAALPSLSPDVRQPSNAKLADSLGLETALLDTKFLTADTLIAADYRLLIQQYIAHIWDSLELIIHDFVAEILKHNKQSMQADTIQDIKISLSDYEALSVDERYYYVVDELQRTKAVASARGVSRFENLLSIVHFSGVVPDEVKDILFELQQVRNVIVHRRGRVDRRFVRDLPAFSLSVGDEIPISADSYRRYVGAAAEYVLLVGHRAEEKFAQ